MRITTLFAAILFWNQLVFGQIGMNSAYLSDWSSQLVFVDLFKQSRSWLPHNAPWDWRDEWESGVAVPLDSLGYPLRIPYNNGSDPPQLVHTLMARDLEGHYPAGTYTLMFEGTGKIRVEFDAETAEFDRAGAWPVNVTPSGEGIHLIILESNANDPIRNIRMIMPGFENTYRNNPFYPPFLDRLQGFAAMRFMNMQNINIAAGNQVRAWQQRKKPDYATQSPGWSIDPNNIAGVAYEYLIDIANRTGLAPWFCIPHKVDDDYLTQLARLLRDNANFELKIYIEYSNEIWNGIYEQNQWCSQQGLALGLSSDPFLAGLLFQAKRSGEIFRIFEQEFGGASRLLRVIAAQASNPWVAEQLMAGLANPAINPYGFNAEALAIAPYFGGGVADEIGDQGLIESITVDEILDRVARDIPAVASCISLHKTLAEHYGVNLIAYEGGQHLVAVNWDYIDNETLTQKLIAANRNARMKTFYRNYLDIWFNNGGGLFMAYNYVMMPSKYGSWGALEWMDQPYGEAPKYQALVEYRLPTGAETDLPNAPLRFDLAQSYPNPFTPLDNRARPASGSSIVFSKGVNPSTAIGYQLPAAGEVELAIYDISGKRVRTLMRGVQNAGAHTVTWDGRDDGGQAVASGIYVYRLVAGRQVQARRMVLLR